MMNSLLDIFHPDKKCQMPPELEGGSHDWTSPDLPTYSTEVTYTCGTARKLAQTHTDGTTTLHSSQRLSCKWDQTWEPEFVSTY